MGRGKAKFPYPWKGERVSVYLNANAILHLQDEIELRSKPIKGSMDREKPKDLTIGLLAQACVYYVLKEKKLEFILPSFKRYPYS